MKSLLMLCFLLFLAPASSLANEVIIQTGDSYAQSQVETYSQGSGEGYSYTEVKATSQTGGNSVSKSQVNIRVQGSDQVEGNAEAVAGDRRESIQIDSDGSYSVQIQDTNVDETEEVTEEIEIVPVPQPTVEVSSILDLLMMKLRVILRNLFA